MIGCVGMGVSQIKYHLDGIFFNGFYSFYIIIFSIMFVCWVGSFYLLCFSINADSAGLVSMAVGYDFKNWKLLGQF